MVPLPEPAATDTPELVADAQRDGIVDRFRELLGEGVVDTLVKPNDDLWIRIATGSWRAAGIAARDRMGFDFMSYLSAIDWLPSPFGRGEDDPTQPAPERATEIVQGYTGGETRFQVLARVYSTKDHIGVTLKVDVPDDDPVVESWVPVYAGANWHERQCHELFGIGFAGHPDLRNFYLPTEFEGYPLRKDFPLLARIVKPWPGIVDVEPLPGEPEEAAAAPADGEATEEAPA